MKNKKPAGRILWKIFLGMFAVLFAVFLELNRHTLLGWVLAALLLAAFAMAREKRLRFAGVGKRLLAWALLAVGAAGIAWLSWPPVKAVPAVAASHPKETQIVHTAAGDLTGVYTLDEAVEVYAGVPYAQPPTGDLRWREPQPLEKWDGVLKADRFAPMSMQTQSLPIVDNLKRLFGYHEFSVSLSDNCRTPASEDSLYLNIWKPAGQRENLPVLVYVHGGSLQSGQPWYEDYSGEGLARQGVIVVNMGYRLGVFGFFADEELAAESPSGTTGNYGLLDQICALAWVRDNIAAFGGDPGNVTLAGESAGAACVTALCTSPLAKGLFRRVIAESSTTTAKTPTHSFRSLEDALQAGKKTRERLGVSSLAELRSLPAEKIVDELNAHHHLTVDGYALTETPYASYQKGQFNEEARLHGFNLEESGPFLLFGQATLKNYAGYVRALLGSEQGERFLKAFPAATDAEAQKLWADLYSAYYFSYGHYRWEQQAKENGVPSYEYLFSKHNGRLGCWHSGEEIYFYGNIPAGSRLFQSDDRELSRVMSAYFVQFVKTGNPNGDGLPEWPANTGADGRLLVLDEQVRLGDDPFLPFYDFIEQAE